MRIISCNLNGIRSAARKGFFVWLEKQNADVVCVQELKAQEKDVIPTYQAVGALSGTFHYAEKPGYSGVGIYARQKPDRVRIGWGWPDADREGRYLRADFGRLAVISLYLPSGSSSEERQRVKYRFMDQLLPELKALRASRRHVVLCGDWNIAHTKKDIKNWRGNQKNSGFLPEERAWMTQIFDEVGLVDAFRRVNPGSGRIYLVVVSRSGLGKRRWLADRLPGGHTGLGQTGKADCDLQGRTLFGSRPAEYRLRLCV